jgi:hypothetical protein
MEEEEKLKNRRKSKATKNASKINKHLFLIIMSVAMVIKGLDVM